MRMNEARKVVIDLNKKHILVEADRPALEALQNVIGSLRLDRALNRARCSRSPHNLMRIRGIFGRVMYKPSCLPLLREMRSDYKDFMELSKMGGEVIEGNSTISHRWKVPPFRHQELLLSYAITMKHACIFADCGAGKTAVGVSLVEWFKHMNGGVKALVVCPLSIIQKAWGEDIERFSDLNWTSLWFPSKAPTVGQKRAGITTGKELGLHLRKEELARSGIDVWVANYETIQRPDFVLPLTAKGFDIVIVDEASLIKNHTTKRFKGLVKISEAAKHRLVLTGTPAPNGVLDLWSQFYFVDRGMTLDPNYFDYRTEVASPIRLGNTGLTKWQTKPNISKSLVPKISRRSVSIKLTDCVDLPPITVVERPVHLPKENRRAYGQMSRQLFAEIEQRVLSVNNQLAKIAKLRQITGGYLYDTEHGGDIVGFKSNPKLDELELVLEEIGNKDVIVWAEFQSEIEAILERFSHRNPIALYGGSGGQVLKDEAFDKFRGDPSCTLCVAHPQSAGVGLTMTWVQYSISYSISYRYDDDYQKNRRIYRPGQTNPVVFMYLYCPDTVDSTMLSCVKSKKSLSDMLTPGSFDPSIFKEVK